MISWKEESSVRKHITTYNKQFNTLFSGLFDDASKLQLPA
jgi:hypothetical protein